MGIITGISKRLEVPGDPGAWITIRKLGWVDLVASKAARLEAIVDMAKKLSDLRDAIASADRVAPVDPFLEHDQATLLDRGITAWSYGNTVTQDALDSETAEWAAREILALALSHNAGESRFVGHADRPGTAAD